MDTALSLELLPFGGDRQRSRARRHLFAAFEGRERGSGGSSNRGDVESLNLNLPVGPEAPQLARRHLDTLAERLDGARLYELRLLVTELVTNCVRHAGLTPSDSIGFDVFVSSNRTRVEVSDAGQGFDDAATGSAPEAAEDPVLSSRGSGWGLHLVEQLSDRWGITRENGTRVWFEVDARADRGVTGSLATA
jgi:anti-sigma regulatory factor (Ser/Thr protein kinase)